MKPTRSVARPESGRLVEFGSFGPASSAGWVRILTFLALAGVVAVLDVTSPPLLVGTLALLVLSELLMWSRSEGLKLMARPLLDTAALMVLVAVEPRLFASALLVLCLNFIWQSLRHSELMMTAAASGLVGVILLGWYQQADMWLLSSAVAVVVTGGYYLLSVDIRGASNRTYEELSRVLQSSAALVYEVDAETGSFTSISGPMQEVLGWTADEWAAIPLVDVIHPDDMEAFSAPQTGHDGFTDRKARFRYKGTDRWVWIRDIARTVTGPGGRKITRGLAIDVTALEDAHQVIRYQAERDQLTALPNRFVMTEELDDRLADKRGFRSRFALLMLDLNRFKEINDSFGHDVGDEVLVATAGRLQALMRPGDLVARLGGDEFVVLADNVATPAEAEAVARRISAACSEPLRVRGMQMGSTVSIGIALASAGNDAAELLKAADIAMYRAKKLSSGQSIFVPEAATQNERDMIIAAGVPQAIEEEDFVLYFQPKADVHTGDIRGVEGLVRWRHEEFGLLHPADFLHLIELSDSRVAFTCMVLDQGVRFARELLDLGLDLQVAVNVSVNALRDADFPVLVQEALNRHEVAPQHLILEITEQGIMERGAGSAPLVLSAVSNMGVLISIDDFGTGYSSFARLRDLPVGEIKIDRRFVAAAPASESDRVIVQSIVDLANNLGMRVVAEGVERKIEADVLAQAGCFVAQGFMFGRPTAPDLFVKTFFGSHRLGSAGVTSETEDLADPPIDFEQARRDRDAG